MKKLSASGLESTPDFPGNSGVRLQSGAESGARDDDSATLADSRRVADPLLARFLAAWDRLPDADRLRLVDEVERLADR